ncbi:MAG: hypothetical protein FWE15_20175 [Actinomycetia bacterium]|nr:hypothetical protein [Actinomycetes bacterium]
MFGYELQQERRNELQRQADQWRLVRDAKAARSTERRARRTQARAAVRTDTEGSATSLGRIHRAVHPHSAS